MSLSLSLCVCPSVFVSTPFFLFLGSCFGLCLCLRNNSTWNRNKGKLLSGLCLYFLLPGQLLVSHFILSCSLPSQLFPPCAGGGFVHDLLLSFCPFPHGLLQFDHSVQFVHPPFTYNREWNICCLNTAWIVIRSGNCLQIVYTKPVNIHSCALWLATQARDILSYQLVCKAKWQRTRE